MSETFDLHQQITDQIIRALETSTDDFVMPWHRAAATGHPVNATSQRRYNGINAISLWVASTLRQVLHHGVPRQACIHGCLLVSVISCTSSR